MILHLKALATAATLVAAVCYPPDTFEGKVARRHFNPAPAYSTENGIFGGRNFWSSDGCYLGSTYIDKDGKHVFYDGTIIPK